MHKRDTASTAIIPGLFISFEGIDGAGKSSHIAPLADALEAQGRRVTRTREPGGTPLAESIRSLLLAEPMDPLTEALLAFAARRDHLCQVIVPALVRGDVVLCDRFTDATFAYQGGGRGLDTELLSKLELMAQTHNALGPDLMLEPHLTLWFDLPPAVAARRLQDARAPDRFEALDSAFFQRVSDGYAKRVAAAPGRFERIDAGQSQTAVWAQVSHTLVQRGWLAEPSSASTEVSR